MSLICERRSTSHVLPLWSLDFPHRTDPSRRGDCLCGSQQT